MGGSVGLKGTDGEEIFQKSLELGAVPRSAEKAATHMMINKTIREALLISVPPGENMNPMLQKNGSFSADTSVA